MYDYTQIARHQDGFAATWLKQNEQMLKASSYQYRKNRKVN
jgi:hypothetical protein